SIVVGHHGHHEPAAPEQHGACAALLEAGPLLDGAGAVKRLTALVLIAALVLAQFPPSAFADDSDIFGANIQPNVMILLDNSLSMTNNGTQGQGGGAMVAQIGTDVATMKTAVDGITPYGYTPLGEFLYDGGQYFKGQALRNGQTYASPIQASVGECQPNFIILITDGLQNGSMDVRTEATNRYTQDHASSFTGTQNVIVHTIGFGIGVSEPGNVIAAND